MINKFEGKSLVFNLDNVNIDMGMSMPMYVLKWNGEIWHENVMALVFIIWIMKLKLFFV